MIYFAGLFDAEGYVSLMGSGHFLIGTEMANEEIPNSFQKTFGGKIYSRKRESRKKTFTWDIATNRDEALNFIECISSHSVIKKPQLLLLKDYLSSTRMERKEFRETIRHDLANLKKPLQVSREYLDQPTDIIPDISFFEWMAGMLDGDGNFCLYEIPQNRWTSFQSWIGIFNIHPDPIALIKKRLAGSISTYRQSVNPIWKWACAAKIQPFVCKALLPFLRIKKESCKTFLEYFEIKKTKERHISYSNKSRDRIRELIKHLKHLNSL